jgi:hypothetical protein
MSPQVPVQRITRSGPSFRPGLFTEEGQLQLVCLREATGSHQPLQGSTFRARSSKRWSALSSEAISRRTTAISALPILADQIIRGWIKRLGFLILG